MANMSYCRFHNTLMALRDCKEALEERDLPKPSNQEEYRAMLHLIEMCQDIADNFNADELRTEEYWALRRAEKS